MVVKRLQQKGAEVLRQRQIQKRDQIERRQAGSVTDAELRKSARSMIRNFALADGNYVNYVRKATKFEHNSDYNAKMLAKARHGVLMDRIGKFNKVCKSTKMNPFAVAVGGARLLGGAVFNKEFRGAIIGEMRRPLEKLGDTLAKRGGPSAKMVWLFKNKDSYVPYDAKTAALTELAQTQRYNEDMRKTSNPEKREFLTEKYNQAIASLYDSAGQDGVSPDSIERMRNIMIDIDSRSDQPKFAHLYSNLEFARRDCQRVEFYDHLKNGSPVWEGDFKDSRTGKPLVLKASVPAFGEELGYDLDKVVAKGIQTYVSPDAVAEEMVQVHKLAENEGVDFSKQTVKIPPLRSNQTSFSDFNMSQMKVLADEEEAPKKKRIYNYKDYAYQPSYSVMTPEEVEEETEAGKEPKAPSIQFGEDGSVTIIMVREKVGEDENGNPIWALSDETKAMLEKHVTPEMREAIDADLKEMDEAIARGEDVSRDRYLPEDIPLFKEDSPYAAQLNQMMQEQMEMLRESDKEIQENWANHIANDPQYKNPDYDGTIKQIDPNAIDYGDGMIFDNTRAVDPNHIYDPINHIHYANPTEPVYEPGEGADYREEQPVVYELEEEPIYEPGEGADYREERPAVYELQDEQDIILEDAAKELQERYINHSDEPTEIPEYIESKTAKPSPDQRYVFYTEDQAIKWGQLFTEESKQHGIPGYNYVVNDADKADTAIFHLAYEEAGKDENGNPVYQFNQASQKWMQKALDADQIYRMNVALNTAHLNTESELPDSGAVGRVPDVVQPDKERDLLPDSPDAIAREAALMRVPDYLAHDIVEARFDIQINKEEWKQAVEHYINRDYGDVKQSTIAVNNHYVYGGSAQDAQIAVTPPSERVREEMEFNYVNQQTHSGLDKALETSIGDATKQEDSVSKIEFNLNKDSAHNRFVKWKTVLDQERGIAYEETVDRMKEEVKETPSITDDELLAAMSMSDFSSQSRGGDLQEEMESLMNSAPSGSEMEM